MLKKFLLLGCLSLFGCQKEEPIVTYRLAKNSDTDTAPSAPMMPPAASASSEKQISWTLPPGWTQQPASSMRVGSFLVKGDGGRAADISIVPLSGDAGGDLSNINRWRGQIDLPPIAETDVEKESQVITPAGRRMRLVDIANGGKRLVATIYTDGQKTWFFKMTGDDALVKATKPAFLKFLASVKIDGNE